MVPDENSMEDPLCNSSFGSMVSLDYVTPDTLRGRQIAYLIYDLFRVTGTHDSVENYTDLFTIVLRNDDTQEFDSKWDGILLSMTKIPHDDILEGLYKLRIRESEKLKTVLELYDLETNQKKLGPDYHRLKVSNKKFEIIILGPEAEILRRTPWSRIREQNSVYKEFLVKVHHEIRLRILSCGRMSENHRGPEVPEVSPSGRMSRWLCKDYLRGTCNNSFCERWHPPECLYYKTKSGCRFAEKCSFAHRQVNEQPTKRSKSNND